jgi:hypothetical protein
VLSLLPAGDPGGHGRRELWITAAASYLAGSIAIEAESRAFVAIGIEAHAWSLAAPWILLAAARWSTLPGMIVPRRGVAPEPSSAIVRAVSWISALAVVLAAWKGSASLASPSEGAARDLVPAATSAADMLVLLAAFGHGLERARRTPLERASWIALLAASLAFGAVDGADRESSRVALCFGAGVAFAIPWLRRADRRAAALSALAFGGAALASTFGALLGATGATWMCACTARSSRKRVGLSNAIVFATCAAIGTAAALRSVSADAPTVTVAIGISQPSFVSACIVAVACVMALRRGAARANATRSTVIAEHGGDGA